MNDLWDLIWVGDVYIYICIYDAYIKMEKRQKASYSGECELNRLAFKVNSNS